MKVFNISAVYVLGGGVSMCKCLCTHTLCNATQAFKITKKILWDVYVLLEEMYFVEKKYIFTLLWHKAGLGREKISGCGWPQLKVLQ